VGQRADSDEIQTPFPRSGSDFYHGDIDSNKGRGKGATNQKVSGRGKANGGGNRGR